MTLQLIRPWYHLYCLAKAVLFVFVERFLFLEREKQCIQSVGRGQTKGIEYKGAECMLHLFPRHNGCLLSPLHPPMGVQGVQVTVLLCRQSQTLLVALSTQPYPSVLSGHFEIEQGMPRWVVWLMFTRSVRC